MVRKRQDVVYGPQSRADVPTPPPAPWRPVMVLVQSPDGSWWYRWWDRGDEYVTGQSPTVDKQKSVIEAVLPAMLADWTRCHGQMLLDIQAP